MTFPRVFVLACVVLVCAIALGLPQARRIWAADVVQDPSLLPATQPATGPAGPLDFTMLDINGKPFDLTQLKGKVVMLVNVASKCGFTPQYGPLENLYTQYNPKGFVIVGIPANNFGGQEPGSNGQIRQFCMSKFGVTFPMMAKVSVKGDDMCPLYHFLTEPQTAGPFAGPIGWNFTKFIIDRNGNLMARFASATTPDAPEVAAAIEKALAAPAAK